MIASSVLSIAAATILVWLSEVSGFSTIPFSNRRIPPPPQNNPRQRSGTSKSLMFSIKFLNNPSNNSNNNSNTNTNTNGDRRDDEDQTQSGLEDEDFSFLKQWPLMPTPGASAPRDTTDPDASQSWSSPAPTDRSITSSRYRGTNPLVNFVQLVEMVAPLQQQPPNTSSNIFNMADQLFRTVMDNTGGLFPSANETTTVQDFIQREQWFDNVQLDLLDVKNTTGQASSTVRSSRLSVTQASALAAASNTNASGTALDAIFQEATSRLEFIVQEAASLTYPSVIPELMEQTRQLFAFLKKTESDATTVMGGNNMFNIAEPEQLRETTTYAANFMAVANAIFTSGYVAEKDKAITKDFVVATDAEAPKPLLADFPSAERVLARDYQEVVIRGAEMGTLAGAIYEDTLRRSLQLGHALVAQGVTANVAWLVTDSLMQGNMVRTLTIRGFDASDESVDREALLNVICTPEPVRLVDDKDILFHKGLLNTAQAIYTDVSKYFDWTTADQKIVLNGHSIGGSLSILVLLLMTVDRGVDYVKQKVARVFAHGNPPMACVVRSPRGMREYLDCPVLKSFNLPSDIVYGYIQPYDPIVRFMTQHDPLYPLVDDLGSDETTLYASGPRRSLRPLTRALFSSWDGWPKFRENWKSTNQSFQSVGVQHLLLPDPQRYLTDRFVSPNVGVPPTDQIVRISSTELLEALDEIFPLDAYQISLIPQAVRSFLHHFYPAYDSSIANYASKVSREQKAEEGRTRNSIKLEASFDFLP